MELMGILNIPFVTVPGKPWLTWSCDVSGMLGQQEEIPLSEWWVSFLTKLLSLSLQGHGDQGRTLVTEERKGPTQLQ